MHPLIEPFEYINDVTDKIDDLCLLAHKTRNKKEKKELLGQANDLAKAYMEHTGNFKLYKKLI